MNSRRDGVDSRTERTRANRRILLVGLAISVGLHGWVFAVLTLAPADLSRTAGAPERVTMQSPFELSSIEVVQVAPEREEVELVPLPTDERPVVAAAAPERNQESTESTAEDAEAGSQVAVADGGSPGIGPVPG